MRESSECNRLIITHSHLCPMVASDFRGILDFEDLVAAGMEGLCEAARDWSGEGVFGKYARAAIKNQILDFIRAFGETKERGEEPGLEFPHQIVRPQTDNKASIEKVFEWQSWGDEGNARAIAENWENLAATPEDILIAFDEIKHAGVAIRSAMIGFTQREREIFDARFFDEPQLSLETIARQHRISHVRVSFLIDRMLGRIKEILESREAATPAAARG